MDGGPAHEPPGSEGRATAVAPPTSEQARELVRRATRVFIAYSHSDLRSAQTCHKWILRLRKGQPADSVFLDQESLAPGSNVSPEDISRRLRESDLFVVLCGADTADRVYVNREIDEAMRQRDTRGLTVLPVILRPRVQLPRALDFHVQGIFIDTLFPEQARRRRALAIALSTLVALLVAAAFVTLRARAQQRASVREAGAQRLAAQARGALGSEPQRALLLAVEAVRATASDGRVLPLAQQALREALGASYGYGLGSHDGPVSALAFTPDGRRLASGSADGTARLWDVTAHDPEHTPIVLRGHTGPLTSLAVDRNGSVLATGSDDGTVRVWKLAEREPRSSAIVLQSPDSGERGRVSRVAISPDGLRVAASGQDKTWLWRLDQGAPARPIAELDHSHDVHVLVVSPDGRWLATEHCDALLFELGAADVERTRRRLPMPNGCVKSVAFSPDGRWLVTGGQDNVARIFDLARANPVAPPVAVNGYVSGVQSMTGIDLVAVLQGDEWFLTGYGDGSVQLWDWRDKKRIEPGPMLRGHEQRVESALSDPQGVWLATRGAEGTVRLWVPASVSPERSGSLLGAHTGVTALAVGPDRWLASGAVDGTVRLARLPLAPGGGAYARSGAATEISADSRWVATARSDGDIWLWDLSADNPTETPLVLPGDKAPIKSLEISPDGRWLATASYEHTSVIHDLRAKDIAGSAMPLGARGEDVWSLAWSGDSRRVIAGGKDGSVLVRDLGPSAAPPLALRHAPDGEVRVLASANGRWLVTGGMRAPVRVFDLALAPPVEVAALGKEDELMWPLLLSADSRWLVLGSGGCRVSLFDLEAKPLRRAPLGLQVCDGDSFALDVTHDGRRLVTGADDGRLRLWDLTVNDLAARAVSLGRHDAKITRVAFSPDGRRLVTADATGVVRLFDMAAPDVAASASSLRGHDAAVTTVNFSSDRRWLVTGDAGGVVRLFDLGARDLNAGAYTLRGHEASVAWVTTSPDSRWVLSLGTDTSVYLSSLSLDWLLQRAPRSAGRNLRADEWAQFFPGEPYRPTFRDLPAVPSTASSPGQRPQ